jgi:gliding motility-associated-like protein
VLQISDCNYLIAGTVNNQFHQFPDALEGVPAYLANISMAAAPSVAITSNVGNATCPGAPVKFTAVPTDGGLTPAYQWKKNGANVGTNQATYTTTTLANGDVITVVMTSSAECATTSTATSNSITMSVSSSLATPAVTITSNSSYTCDGRTNTFTAQPTNGGSAPVYQWKKNNVNVGTNNPTYSSAGLVAGDVINVVMTSNANCVTTPTATSNAITIMSGVTSGPSSVSISVSPNSTSVYAGDTRTFTAVPVNGGPSPQYKWYRGDNIVATGSTYTTNAFSGSGAEVRVEMVPNPPCAVTPLAAASMQLQVYPQPGPSLLSVIQLNDIELTPVSGTATFNYEATVPAGLTYVDLFLQSGENVDKNLNGETIRETEATRRIPLSGTTKVIDISVISADRLYTQTYKITVTRPVSNDATLSGLTLSAGTLSPAFTKNTTAYSTSLSTTVTSITVTPTVILPSATIKVNGVSVASGSASAAIPLVTGHNTVNIVVTAEDGTTTKTYTLDVFRALVPSTNATLSNLVISYGINTGGAVLSPAFSANTTAYSIKVPASSATFGLTPTVADPEATVKVNGATVVSGSQSPVVTLAYGHNTINVVVTAADATTTKTYAVDVYRAPVPAANNADLLDLLTSRGTLSPAFSPGVTAYSLSVQPGSTSVKLTPFTASDAMIIKINGKSAANGVQTSSIALVAGHNTINVVVTALNGTTTKQYQIDVFRPSVQGDAMLNIVSLTKSSPDSTLYSLIGPAADIVFYVPGNITSVTLGALPINTKSTLKFDGVVQPSSGSSKTISLAGVTAPIVVSIQLIAPDGILTKNYTVTIVRLPDVSLSALTISAGTLSPAFASNKLSYSTSVPASTTFVTVTPTAFNPTSIVTANGVRVASGTASAPIPVHAGYNLIRLVITTADGKAFYIYTVEVRRAASSNAVLSQILTNPNYHIETTTGTADFNRLIRVPKSVTNFTVAATPQHAFATIEINGKRVAAGVASSPIYIGGYNDTVVHIVVTAENGTTQKTYDLHIERPSDNAFFRSIETDPDYRREETTGPADFNRVMTVPWHVTSMRFATTPQHAAATVKVNGSTVATGAFSNPVSLSALTTVVNIVVTAEDKVTKKTYAITVNRSPSENAVLASITTNPHVSLTATTGPADFNRTASVSSGVSSITFAAVPQNSHASIKINGATVASGVASAPIALSTGPNTINIVVTAEDGVTVKTYAITVTRAASFMMASKNTGDGLPNIGLKEDREDTPTEQLGLSVRQGLSPNGDGINDRLAITGINAYPDNTVKVMNRNGDVIYQAKGYDNTNVAFDGRNSKGVLQQPGTYFYSVEYKEGGQIKRKTGYLVIKY